jgi:hypothetical protein
MRKSPTQAKSGVASSGLDGQAIELQAAGAQDLNTSVSSSGFVLDPERASDRYRSEDFDSAA